MNKIEHPKHAFQSNESDFNELRDWFAGMAMQSLLRDAQTRTSMNAIPRDAYLIADAMLEDRKQDSAA